MSSASPLPPLSRSLCFSQSTLLSFLHSSRSMIDDSISTNLNALSTPSRTSSSSIDDSGLNTSFVRQPYPSQQPLPRPICDTFINTVLFPSWQAREQVLDYCTAVSQAPDPDDPEAAAREAYNRAGQQRLENKNERLDPYSGRFFREKSRSEELADFCERERVIEDIVRERSWDVVRSRCGGDGRQVDMAASLALDQGGGNRGGKLYTGAFSRWRMEQQLELVNK